MEVSRKRLKRWWQQDWNGHPRCDWLHISWPSKPAPTPALRPQWRASVSGPPEQLHSPQRSEHKFSLAQLLSTLTMTSWNQKIFLTKGDICIYSLSASPEYRWSILANFLFFCGLDSISPCQLTEERHHRFAEVLIECVKLSSFLHH